MNEFNQNQQGQPVNQQNQLFNQQGQPVNQQGSPFGQFSQIAGQMTQTLQTVINQNMDPQEEQEVIKPYADLVRIDDIDSQYIKSPELFVREKINAALGSSYSSKHIYTKKTLTRFWIKASITIALTSVYTTMIFFHFPIATYLIGLILLAVPSLVGRKSEKIPNYIFNQILARRDENIDNLIQSLKLEVFEDKKAIILKRILLIAAIVLPCLFFINPKIIYEEADKGYAVRYYIAGLSSLNHAEIPEEHNGKPVVSLRGNTFSNMPFLKTVSLPDSIKEIRGQAFLNCISLSEVKLPDDLSYLGGGSFKNSGIRSIELPDSLWTLGGESFYGCSKLSYIKLSSGLTEINGDTFTDCKSLKEIAIPDSVARIGGHAFEGCKSLSKVSIGPDSHLNEIGSSAFRSCSALKEISLPKETTVNSRAFKESPTKIKRYQEEDNSYGY